MRETEIDITIPNLEALQENDSKAIILCVDDEWLILRSLTQQLKKNFGKEYAIEMADNPLNALDLIKEYNQEGLIVPLVISDYMMPQMKGDDFLIKIQELSPNTKKIMLTGQADAEAVGNAVNKADLYRYLSKPWDIYDLIFTVKEGLHSFYMERSLEEKNKELKKALLFNKITQLPNEEFLIRKLNDFSENPALKLALIKIETYSTTTRTFGLAIYQELLLKLIAILKSHIAESGDIYHIYEDEIAVLSELSDELLQQKLTAFKMLLKSEYITVQGVSFQMQLTIVTVSGKSDELFEKAKLAMVKEEKRSELSGLIFFSEGINDDILRQNLYWAQKLNQALKNKSLVPYFQGIRDNRTGSVTKFECLARMVENEKLIYTPDKFIDLAKTTGTVRLITLVLIDKALSYFKLNSHSFSLNLTEFDLEHRGFVNWVESKLNFYEIAPERVTFELLENVTLNENSQTKNTLYNLRELGCKIAIDDFGVQNSNLSRLLDIQPDFIKIDGKFIRNINKNKKAYLVTAAITELSHRLGAEVIAEYVTDVDVQNTILSLGIEYSQGFYIMKPSPYTDII